MLVWAGSILPEAAGGMLREWSIGEQLNEFGRGILSFSHLFYFATLIAVMLYLSMVFISARHWRAGASSASHLVLYGAQIVALLAIGLNLCILFVDTVRATGQRATEFLGPGDRKCRTWRRHSPCRSGFLARVPSPPQRARQPPTAW